MTCERARELLMERETAAIAALRDGVAREPGDEDLVTHLASCAACREFASQLIRMDESVADHVEDFAERGDFATEWESAKAKVAEIRRRPVHRTFFALAALAAMLLLVTRVALLPIIPIPGISPAPHLPPLPPTPAPEPVVSTPIADPVASFPLPAPQPAGAPSPDASVPTSPRPSPKPAPPARPRAEPSPIAAMPSQPRPAAREVTVEIDAGIDVRVVTLVCPSASLGGRPAGRTLRFEGVPIEPCVLEIDGTRLLGVASGLNHYRLTMLNGNIALVGR